MNAAFLITPKSEIKFVYDHWTMRQALEKMEHYRYSAIPILSKKGKYVGTLTEGDLLWELKNHDSLDFKEIEDIPLKDIPRYRDISPISINVEIEDIMATSLSHNFVPIVDDFDIFIGLIKRREIISYLLDLRKRDHAESI
ncbi:CBS domain-containing protein [Sporolactobacillus sp. THM7-7]|nr:CBS domain-containing protein [Sporolactobacillus sp. THM7-7]